MQSQISTELLGRARIMEVAAWLDLPKPRGRTPATGRIPATWRNGDGLNVSIHAGRNVWRDHVTGQGGGILDLIELVLGCDRKTAFRWLADQYHVSLDRPISAAERRRYAERREQAQRVAADLAAWRRERLGAIIARRADVADTARRLYIAMQAVAGATEEDWTWEYLWDLTIEAEQLEVERDRIEAASTAELIETRRAA